MSQPDFVEYARIRRENEPLVKEWGFGNVWPAEHLIYNSVPGCRSHIKFLEEVEKKHPERLRKIFGCALSIIARDGGMVSKKTMLDAAMRRLDPAFEAAPDTTHRCHATGCHKAVNPKYLMCYPHWNRVPRELQHAVWRHYRAGQEKDKQPTREYLEAARAAIESVAEGSP